VPQAPHAAYHALHPAQRTFRAAFPNAEPSAPTRGHAPSFMQRPSQVPERPRPLAATRPSNLPRAQGGHPAAAAAREGTTSQREAAVRSSAFETAGALAGDALGSASVAAAAASGLAALGSLQERGGPRGGSSSAWAADEGSHKGCAEEWAASAVGPS
jgi:hypothetical protein